MQGRGAPREPGHPGSSHNLAKTPDKALKLLLHSRLRSGKETPQAADVSTQGTARPGSNCCHRLPSTQQSPPHAPTLLLQEPILLSNCLFCAPTTLRTNAGAVNELGALGPWCCMLHTPGAASDVRKLTWKKHLHTHQQSSPWVCPAGQPLDLRQSCHWTPVCRAGPASSPAEARRSTCPCPALQEARGCCATAEEREVAIEKFPQKGLC